MALGICPVLEVPDEQAHERLIEEPRFDAFTSGDTIAKRIQQALLLHGLD